MAFSCLATYIVMSLFLLQTYAQHGGMGGGGGDGASSKSVIDIIMSLFSAKCSLAPFPCFLQIFL